MSETRPVRITPAVYQALKEMSEQTGGDISATTSFILTLSLLTTDAYKTLSPQAQADLAAELFDFFAYTFREAAGGLRHGAFTWEQIREALKETRKK